MSSQDDLKALRRRMIEVCAASGEGHLPSSCSVLELIYALHTSIMLPSDRFILSKGHASLALYAVLEHIGKIPKQWLDEFCQPGAKLLGHPERDPEHGIESTTGALGHGVPMAAGLAYGMRLAGNTGRVFCIVGDGECQEGSVWEGAQIAAAHGLSNLICIVDENRSNELPGQNLSQKFSAFGWCVDNISGHSPPALQKALARTDIVRPYAIIAHTVKGYGIPMCELDPKAWHHRAPNAAERLEMLAAL